MRALFHSINGRILLIPVVALIALMSVGAVSIHTIGNVILVEHQARARVVAEAATKIVESLEAKAVSGAIVGRRRPGGCEGSASRHPL